MNDQMNELVQFSPFAGKLYLETVAGETSKKIEHENDVKAADGVDRTMYAYAPKSGCPDPKQGQVLLVLRDGSDEASAQALLEELKLAELAEQEHFLVLFPNPAEGGWNYQEDPARDNDIDFLIRCFGALRTSKLGVNGFNGMIFHLAVSESASALLMTMAARRPLNMPAMMIGPFPADYAIPADAKGIETAAWVSNNPTAEYYLKKANGVSSEQTLGEDILYLGTNPNVRLAVSKAPLSAEVLYKAWDQVFSLSRRWQNDTYGTYQTRAQFTARGFVAHVKDDSLGVNDGFKHTWYEYIPPQLRGTEEKVPLVFYFHGVNCVPLYGAEQSNFQEIADWENFIVVYPAPAKFKAWNIFNDPTLPSDFDFVMALIEHMKQVHPIDETRIYATGFSMGSMMTHALCGAFPEVFAAGAGCNAYDFAYFKVPKAVFAGVVKGADPNALAPESAQKKMADEKWSKQDYRMPFIQNVGWDDGITGVWPAVNEDVDVRYQTLNNWKKRNNIPTEPFLDSTTVTGIAADESFWEAGERLYHQRWRSADPGNPVLFEQIYCMRMPHAIDYSQTKLAWEFIKKFRRMADGSLKIEE